MESDAISERAVGNFEIRFACMARHRLYRKEFSLIIASRKLVASCYSQIIVYIAVFEHRDFVRFVRSLSLSLFSTTTSPKPQKSDRSTFLLISIYTP